MKLALITVGAALCLCESIYAASYFVATNGLDTNPGSQAQPFLTVQKGVNSAFSGDTVFVGSGTYTGRVDSARGGTPPIIIDGQGLATIGGVYSSHSNIHYRNFTISGENRLFLMERGSHFNVISNCVFDGAYNTNMTFVIQWTPPTPLGFDGADVPWGSNIASGCIIVSNLFKRGVGCPMIQCMGETNLVYGNLLIDGDAVDWFQVWGRSNHIFGNICSNGFVSGIDNNHPDWFQSFGLNGAGAKGNILESNVVISMSGTQLGMLEGQDCVDIGGFTFRNNYFHGISHACSINMPDVAWYNNTFSQCNTNEVGGSGGAVLVWTSAEWDGSVESPPGTRTNYAASVGIGGRCYNNVFLNCGGTNTDRGWYTFSSDLTNVSADYNFVAKNNYLPVLTNAAQQRIGDAGGWSKTEWWEDHGINGGNPQFVNEVAIDFRLQAGSPLIDSGTNLTFTTDFIGVSRPQGVAWDIGAYEFVAAVLHHKGVSIQGRRRFAR